MIHHSPPNLRLKFSIHLPVLEKIVIKVINLGNLHQRGIHIPGGITRDRPLDDADLTTGRDCRSVWSASLLFSLEDDPLPRSLESWESNDDAAGLSSSSEMEKRGRTSRRKVLAILLVLGEVSLLLVATGDGVVLGAESTCFEWPLNVEV